MIELDDGHQSANYLNITYNEGTIDKIYHSSTASVLNHSIAEVDQWNHGQTTVLHMVATLLSSPSSFLRQAYIRSHHIQILASRFSVEVGALTTTLNLPQAHQSVSRVMREASFSSPAVKATIEQSLNSNVHANHHANARNVNLGGTFGGISPMMLSTTTQLSTPPTTTPSTVVPLANRNIYLNPRLQQGAQGIWRIGGVKK
ncbi:Double Clp-N motif-containing P-loop nucleoside triphosphate hydrolase superfamily protein [Abeliophyllum distichum]|uniref:Double Clp-N motif-containing P-loop nucleoside triphosphate hydrolase superfamily protein n=1 Tax=Abeliophyllum distichum TaxID=126358 RepID=A0ABD1SZG7_9LAMI